MANTNPLMNGQFFVKFSDKTKKTEIYIMSCELTKYSNSRITKKVRDICTKDKNTEYISIVLPLNEFALRAVKYFFKNDSWDHPRNYHTQMELYLGNNVKTTVPDICKYFDLPLDPKCTYNLHDDDQCIFQLDEELAKNLYSTNLHVY